MKRIAGLLIGLSFLAVPAAAQGTPTPFESRARDLLRELIEINTTHSVGSTTRAAEAMARHLRAAGFTDSDLIVAGPTDRKGNLVARLQGRDAGRKPVMVMAHLDVVEADPADWSVDPFTFLEQDGYFYGRGTADDKSEAAIWAAVLMRMKQEGYVPNRDIILILTADEEGGPDNGVTWLLENHPDWIDAGFALNEGGGGALKHGKRLSNNVQASEKVYQTFTLETTNPGGHSSLPRQDNAIYELSRGLLRVADYQFPIELNEITRTYFERTAPLESPAVATAIHGVLKTPPDRAAAALLSGLPEYNSRLRTTCVATMLAAGHAENALPQRATATVNCRLLPGQSVDSVRATLAALVADTGVSIIPVAEATPSPPSPLTPEVMGAIEQVTQALWPGVPVIPTMSTGATDGLFLRRAGIPVYGVSGLFYDVDDVREHGRDERVLARSFYEALNFCNRLLRLLTGATS